MLHPSVNRLFLFATWAICTAGTFWAFGRTAIAVLDVDEIYWVGSAYYYDLAFVQRDWRHPDWNLLPARENPPVAKYAIGAGLALTGQRVPSPDMLAAFYAIYENVPGAWGTGEDHAKRARVVQRMNAQLRQKLHGSPSLTLENSTLLPARRVMIVCAVLTSLFVLVFATATTSWLPALVASQAVLMHPTIIYAYNHAMADAVALCFSTAAGLCALFLFRRVLRTEPVRPWPGWICVSVCGFLLALACGAKMNSLIVAALVGVTLLVAVGRTWKQHGRRRGAVVAAYGAGIFAAAFLAFVAINPTIVNDLGGGLIATVREHKLTEAVQAGFLADRHLLALPDKFQATASLAFFGTIPCVGLILVACCAIRSRSDGIRFAAWWWFLAVVAVTFWLPFAWQRYVVPIIVPTVLLIAYALHQGINFLRSSLKGRRAAGV